MTVTAASVRVRPPLPGTGAKLMARMSAATMTIDSTPPRLSIGSVDSFTWLGT